jgi:uncharacterized protein
MALHILSPVETRIVGCLMEKERTTPENYPLSLNSLALACNQSTNRDPIVSYDEKLIEETLWDLREKKLAVCVFGDGARVQKYRHSLLEHYELSRADAAVMCVLMLRGPQTVGELRTRTERLYPFRDLGELESCLSALQQGSDPLVRYMPQRPGQKERRYAQLLSGEPVEPDPSTISAPTSPMNERVTKLEQQCAALQLELADLRETFQAFRKHFE